MEMPAISLHELREGKRHAILDLARRHGAGNIRVYGSVARGEATHDSDLDLLVEWEPGRSLLDLIALKQARGPARRDDRPWLRTRPPLVHPR